jgi:phosphatidylethanolamine-binding protein (PEBP) family uncharacterized protein
MFRGWRPRVMAMSGLAVVVALAGCGSVSTSASRQTTQRSRSTSTSAKANAPTAVASNSTEKVPDLDLRVRIPGLGRRASGFVLPKRYTCDGADVSPPIVWGHVPAHTVEIDVFLVSIEKEVEYTQWAVSGISPRLRGIRLGTVPFGAVVGRNRDNQDRYKLCPDTHGRTSFAVLYFPLPRKLPARRGFNAKALAFSAVHTAPHEGQFFFTYKRP